MDEVRQCIELNGYLGKLWKTSVIVALCETAHASVPWQLTHSYIESRLAQRARVYVDQSLYDSPDRPVDISVLNHWGT